MKLLVNPLLIFLLINICIFNYIWWWNEFRGYALLLFLWSSIILAVFSMPFFGDSLKASLQVAEHVEKGVEPRYLFVLAGGYELGAIVDQDLLTYESQSRILKAVAVWKRFPNSYLVFSGGSHEEGRNDAHQAEMARTMALTLGVMPERIILETQSRNTLEHPLEALQLPGISTTIPIGVVTSAWHIRRAQNEFCRYFQQIALFPVPAAVRRSGFQSFIPNADSLENNTTLLREYFGLLWYAIIHRFEYSITEQTYCAP